MLMMATTITAATTIIIIVINYPICFDVARIQMTYRIYVGACSSLVLYLETRLSPCKKSRWLARMESISFVVQNHWSSSEMKKLCSSQSAVYPSWKISGYQKNVQMFALSFGSKQVTLSCIKFREKPMGDKKVKGVFEYPNTKFANLS